MFLALTLYRVRGIVHLIRVSSLTHASAGRSASRRDSDSRVVISTRVRGLLKGAASIEVNVPSEQDAIRILMAAAEMPSNSPAPAAAPDIVRQCGRLRTCMYHPLAQPYAR